MSKIRRTKTIEGIKVPGFICNGGRYFFNYIDVYEDGMVNCWELVDLEGLTEKLDIGWLVPKVPLGEGISIHGLGYYKVVAADWQMNKTRYQDYIHDKVRGLNPSFTNIYQISNEEKKLWQERRVKYSPSPEDFVVTQEVGYSTEPGDGFTIFMKHRGRNYLVRLLVYRHDTVICYCPHFELTFKLDQMRKLWDEGIFFTSIKTRTPIIWDDLGILTVIDGGYACDVEEKFKEFMDISSRVKGEKSVIEKCREAYFNYLEYPNEYTRSKLKEAYEIVPEHQRMYLGDMDNKDYDYVRIIYHPEQKREV